MKIKWALDALSVPSASAKAAASTKAAASAKASAPAPKCLPEAAPASKLLPSHLLPLKMESLTNQLTNQKVYSGVPATREVVLSKESLGSGTASIVYKGSASWTSSPVAIKLFRDGIDAKERATLVHASYEVKRYASVPTMPHILKLLDVGLFSPPTGNQPRPLLAGLVFEGFNTTSRSSWKFCR